jgi:hypothetical protein
MGPDSKPAFEWKFADGSGVFDKIEPAFYEK